MIFLSRISSLKREMKKITLIECSLDLLTLSLSYVFYETLVLKSAVNKVNRKVCAGACLILAAKLNDVKGTALSGLIDVRSIWGISNQYYNSLLIFFLVIILMTMYILIFVFILQKIENVFRVSRKDLLASEFAVLVALEFGLHVPTWQVYPHYQRLLHEV